MKNIYTLVCFLWALGLTAQILEKETIVDLSKDQARYASYNGYPNEIVVKDDVQQFELVYVTKAKAKHITKNRLIFDYNLNLVDTKSEEYVLKDFDKSSKKVKAADPGMPANFRGEEYSLFMLTVGGMLKNEIQKMESKYRYNWTRRDYDVETKMVEKLKTKELLDGGNMKNPYMGHYNDPLTGDLMLITGTLDKATFSVKSYKVTRINLNMEGVNTAEISFQYVQRPFYAGNFQAADGTDDHVYIFGAAGGKGVYKPKENQSPEPNSWTYVRLNSYGELVNRTTFKTKANNWQILGVVEKEGSVYVYGPGESKGVGTDHQGLMDIIGTGKQDVFQILKVTGDKTNFVSGPMLEEINGKLSKPAGQKAALTYDGKRVKFGNFNIASNGDLFINAQDWKMDVRSSAPLYSDQYMFHFQADGTFKRLYGIESIKNKAGLAGGLDPSIDPRFYPDEGEVFAGKSGSMYWNLYTVNEIHKYVSQYSSMGTQYTETTWIKRYTGAIAKFDPAAGRLEDYVKLGNKDFYLYAIPSAGGIPSIAIDGGTKKIFIGYGANKETGRQIWLAKLDLEKL